MRETSRKLNNASYVGEHVVQTWEAWTHTFGEMRVKDVWVFLFPQNSGNAMKYNGKG